MLLTFDLSGHLWWTLLLVAAGFLAIAVAERMLRGASAGSLFRVIVGTACVLRALLLPLPPTLSGDLDRYIWDGRVLISGANPYVLAPDAPELEPLRDERWQELDHHDVPTVYPPLAQAFFALSASMPRSRLCVKVILALLDLVTCAALWFVAQRWRLPGSRILWYAWNPLVTIEIAGMGHVDGLAVALVVVTTALLLRPGGKLTGAAITAAGAVSAKLVPILAIPVWARQSRSPRHFALLALLLTVVGLTPMLVATGGLPPGLVRYGISWEFNGPLFEPLWRLLEIVDLHGLVEDGLGRLKTVTGNHEFWNLFYPWNYPQLWAKLLLGLGLSVALFRAWRASTTLAALQGVFGGVILFSATVYPWYGLWVLPWAALGRRPEWLALSGLLFLSYLPQFLNVPLFPWVYGLIWLPFSALWIACR